MTSNDILNLIDSAIDDYTLSNDAMRWSPGGSRPRVWPKRVVLVHPTPEQREAMRAAFLDVERQLGLMIEPLRRAFAELHQAFQAVGLLPLHQAFQSVGLLPPERPADPMQRALEARRNRNTGPPDRQRAPRRIDPRRAR